MSRQSFFTDEFVETLRSSPIEGLEQACTMCMDFLDTQRAEWTPEEAAALRETYALIQTISELKLLPFMERCPSFNLASSDANGELNTFIRQTLESCQHHAEKARQERLRNRFRDVLEREFVYEFSQGDLERVQDLINQLRDHITQAQGLEDTHRQRILRKLESLQRELHKKLSDLDRFWGLIGEAGVVIGKLGNDAKPIVDRIREVAQIVWQTQSRAEELPSGTSIPLLASDSGDNSASKRDHK